MRKASMQLGFVALLLVATAGVARAQDATPVATAPAAAPAEPARHRKLFVNLSFLPMSLGEFKSSYGGMPTTLDAAFAPGGSLVVGYEVIRGLSVGIAPQVLFNVKPKEDPITTNPAASREYDAMVRVAYAYSLVDTLAVYGEVLPGFSLVQPKTGDIAKGPVVAVGAGVMMDLTDRWFVNLAGGKQWGFQTRTDTSRITMDGVETVRKVTTDVKFSFWRVALGLGFRF
jgi:hypothetical protein